MVEKRRGFTLVEVLVVILVSTLLLTVLAGTMIYITTTVGDFIQRAEEIEIAKNIEKYFRSIDINDLTVDLNNEDNNVEVYENYIITESSDLIHKSGEVIFYDTGLEEFEISRNTDSNVVKCYMKFHSGVEFEFVVGIIDKENGVSL